MLNSTIDVWGGGKFSITTTAKFTTTEHNPAGKTQRAMAAAALAPAPAKRDETRSHSGFAKHNRRCKQHLDLVVVVMFGFVFVRPTNNMCSSLSSQCEYYFVLTSFSSIVPSAQFKRKIYPHACSSSFLMF